MDKIILLDEENNEVEFEILDTFGKNAKWRFLSRAIFFKHY